MEIPRTADAGSEVQAVFTNVLFTPIGYDDTYLQWQWGNATTRSEKLGIVRNGLFRSFAGTGSIEVKSTNQEGVTLSEKRTMLLGATNQYFYGPRNLVINAGYSQEQRSGFTITFCNTGYYDFDEFNLVAHSMDAFDEKVAALGKASDVSIDCNSITATIKGRNGQWACIAVPRSSGWSATVNGKVADIVALNYEFMGVRLEEGENVIRMQYTTPGLAIGCARQRYFTGGLCCTPCMETTARHFTPFIQESEVGALTENKGRTNSN